MARGKYANSAAARRAREEAEAEVVAGRRKIVQLTQEVAELRADLARERKEWSDRAAKYVALMNEGSAPEVVRLRDELTTLRAASQREREQRARAVVEVLAGTPWVERSGNGRQEVRLAEALGVTPGFILDLAHPTGARRSTRRLTKNRANLNRDVMSDPSLVAKR